MSALARALGALRAGLSFAPRRGVRLAGAGPWLELPDAVEALRPQVEARLGRPPRRAPRRQPWDAGWLERQLHARGAAFTCFEGGFRLQRRSHDGAFVSDGATRLWVTEASALRPPHAALGAAVSVRAPCGRDNLCVDRFTLVSRAGPPRRAGPFELVLGLTAEGALEVVDRLLLDRVPSRARFVAEVTRAEGALPSCDALRLAAEAADARRLLFWVRGLARDERHLFLPLTHPLTAPLGRGIGGGAAPVPTMGRRVRPAFISHRAGLIAQALLRSLVSGASPARAVAERFAEEGLSLDAPWRGGGAQPWLRW